MSHDNDRLEDLEAENARLAQELRTARAEIERLKMWEDSFAGGVRERMDANIARLQEERDSFKSWFENAIETIVTANYRAATEQRNNHQLLANDIASINVQFGKHNAPLTLIVASALLRDYQVPLATDANDIVQNNPVINQRNLYVLLEHTIKTSKMTGAMELMQQILQTMLAWGNDPETICHEIAWELRMYNKCYMPTVSRLELLWVKDNINSRIGSHDTLKEHLELGFLFQQSGMTQDGFSAENHVSRGKLKLAIRCYAKLEGIASA